MQYIFIILYIILMSIGIEMIEKDKEFNIKIANKERFRIAMQTGLSSVLFQFVDFWPSVFLLAGMTVLHISAITDEKTKTLYFAPIYILAPLGVLCESMIAKEFSFVTIFFLVIAIFIHFIGGYAKGDILIAYIPAAAFYIANLSNGCTFNAGLLYWIVSMIIACIFMIVKAIKTNNLQDKKTLKMKVSQPFGPYILYGSYITLIVYMIAKLVC